MWETGAIRFKGNNYKYQVKVYEAGSQYGINGGKISKAYVTVEDTKAVIDYDRGWIVKPESNTDGAAILDLLLHKVN